MGLKWVRKLKGLRGGVERGISPQCQGEKNAIHILTAHSCRDRREERGISGKDIADYKGRESIKENCGVHQNY